MPAYSTLDLIYEIHIAIASIRDGQEFTLDELAERMDESRRIRGEKRKVSSDSLNRILTKLWLFLGIGKTQERRWKKGASPIRSLTHVRPEIVEKVIHTQKIFASPKDIDNWIVLGEEPTTHKAYICYPYRDNPFRRSLELLILLILIFPKVKNDFAPATPHEMYWGLEERTDRTTAMNKCEELIENCDFLLYCLSKKDTPSKGMIRDMKVAKAKGKKIRYIEDILGYYPNITEIMMKCGLSEFIQIISIAKPT